MKPIPLFVMCCAGIGFAFSIADENTNGVLLTSAIIIACWITNET